MKDVEIVITIPGSVYAALDEARKANKVPRQDPSNPEVTIIAPQFASVEEFIEGVVEQNIAPVLAQQPTAEVKAIQAQIAALEEQARVASKTVRSVKAK